MQQRVGIALRTAREERNLTQVEVAKLVGHSQSWVNKIENAQTSRIKQGDLDNLLGIYKITGAKADELRELARTPFDKRGVWVDTSTSPAWWSKYQEVERSARVIKALHLETHDGLIQSEAYMRRQESPPDCTFLLSEACLRRHMGDAAMMLTQLKHLLALSERLYITILVLPFDAHFPASPYGFTFLQFNSATMGDFVSIQYDVGAATIDDENALRLFQRQWELVRSAALGEYDSRRFLRRVLGEYQEIVKGP